jgi:hypothetical protein
VGSTPPLALETLRTSLSGERQIFNGRDERRLMPPSSDSVLSSVVMSQLLAILMRVRTREYTFTLISLHLSLVEIGVERLREVIFPRPCRRFFREFRRR